jgi:predicted nucleic acid-binding protein
VGRDPDGVPVAAEHHDFRRSRVLPFPASAVQPDFELRKRYRRLGKLDLEIAALVLHHNGTFVTRKNRQDFVQIPQL